MDDTVPRHGNQYKESPTKHTNMADVLVLIAKSDLKRATKHVLTMLLSFANFKDAEDARVKMETLAVRADLNANQTRRVLRDAIRLGVVSVVSGGSGGQAVTPTYRFNVDALRAHTLYKTDRVNTLHKTDRVSPLPSTFRSDYPIHFVDEPTAATGTAADSCDASKAATRRSTRRSTYVDVATLSPRQQSVYEHFSTVWTETQGRPYQPRRSDVDQLQTIEAFAAAGGYGESALLDAVDAYFASTDPFFATKCNPPFPLAMFAKQIQRFVGGDDDESYVSPDVKAFEKRLKTNELAKRLAQQPPTTSDGLQQSISAIFDHHLGRHYEPDHDDQHAVAYLFGANRRCTNCSTGDEDDGLGFFAFAGLEPSPLTPAELLVRVPSYLKDNTDPSIWELARLVDERRATFQTRGAA